MKQLGLSNNGEGSPNTGLKGQEKGHLQQPNEDCFLGNGAQTEVMAWGEDTASTQLQSKRQEAKGINTQILLCQRLPLIELKWKPKGQTLLYTEKVREG